MFSFHELRRGEERRGQFKETHNNFTPDGREIMLVFSSSDQTGSSFLPLTAGQREIFERFCLNTSFAHISHRFERNLFCC